MPNPITSWFSKHRETVLVTATALTITGTVAFLIIKGKKVEIPVNKLAESFMSSAPTVPETVGQAITIETSDIIKSFQRKEFIRHLPEGWKASPAKIAEALAKNIVLKDSETLVNACTVTLRTAA